MSTLEVPQNFPVQRRELLSSIGGIDMIDANMVVFDFETHLPRLPHQIYFQIQVIVWDKTIFHAVI
jgi:hypothetical protein